MADTREVRTEDLMPVYSRVSWGALFAGLFVALTIFVVLSVIGAAIGLSAADTARGETIATGAGIWAIVTALVAFFCGGCVTSRCTAGESRTEAAIYGTILWGVTFAFLLWMSGNVMQTGLAAVTGTAQAAANVQVQTTNWEQAARQAGVSPEEIERMRATMPTAAEVQNQSAEAAWWSVAGIVVSLLASIGGAVVGSGPNPIVGGFVFQRTSIQAARG